MSDKLSIPVITRTLSQLQGVEHVLVHPVGEGSSSFTILVWTEDSSIDSHVTTSQQLDELVDIVECHVTDSLVSKKRSLNYRITH
jgi:hypothetical protein